MSTSMIEVRDLVKDYDRTRAVDGINFSVPRGQIVGFLGPNGAGKTTTMKIITGYLKPTAGQAIVRDIPVEEDSVKTRSYIGYLPENAPLYEEMMVRDFLEFIADIRDIPKERRSARIRLMTEVCGIGDVLSKDIGELSKGFRQRVGLAHAMIHDPEILILDEPTSGLDPNQIAEIRTLIRELGREKTLIISTHILPEVQATCDRAIIISGGKLVADDSVESLMMGDGTRVRLSVVSPDGEGVDQQTIVDILSPVEGVQKVSVLAAEDDLVQLDVLSGTGEDLRRELFKAVADADLALIEMQRHTVSLEETFRQLTTEKGGNDA